MLWLGFASRSGVMLSIWMLGGFLLRNFWFIGFEMGQRAATPGKRLMGIRVVARDGGRLTADAVVARNLIRERSEEHTSELQSLMRISYAVFCLKKKKDQHRVSTKN